MLIHEKNVTKTIAILIFSLGFLLEAGRLKIYLRPRPGPVPQVVDLSMGDSSGEPGEAAGALHHRDSQGGTSPQAGWDRVTKKGILRLFPFFHHYRHDSF